MAKIRLKDGTIREETSEEITRREEQTTANLNEAKREQALEKLKEFDAKSIRHLRAYLASQVPELDAIEREAVIERKKL